MQHSIAHYICDIALVLGKLLAYGTLERIFYELKFWEFLLGISPLLPDICTLNVKNSSLLREAIQKKSSFFRTLSKRGWGSTGIQKF